MSFEGFVNAGLQLGSQSIIIKPVRGILIQAPDGSVAKTPDIIAHATIEEHHMDQLEITDHPVQQGATISDHAFKRPAELTLHLGWSNSPPQSSSLTSAGLAANEATAAMSVFNGSSVDQIKSIYLQLLGLQAGRTLFNIWTGKRNYKNMLCKTLSTETTYRTENSLPITMVCQEVILVNASSVTVSMKNAKDQKTAIAPAQTGNKQVVQVKP